MDVVSLLNTSVFRLKGQRGWRVLPSAISMSRTPHAHPQHYTKFSSSIATFLGVPSPISSHHQLKTVRRAIDQLDCLCSPIDRASLAIHEVLCNYTVSLEDADDPSLQLSLTKTFDGSIDTIKQTYSAQWTLELDILSQFVKLNLYAKAVFLTIPDSAGLDDQMSITKHTLLIRGLELASSLIRHVKSISMLPVKQGQYDAGKLTFYPAYFFTSLFFAAIFLFRAFISDVAVSYTHKVFAIEGMVEAHKIFRLLSFHRDAVRASRVIEKLVDKARSGGPSLPPLDPFIATPPWAALISDTISRIRKAVNKAGGPHVPGDSSSDRAMAEPFGPLPPAPEMRRANPDIHTDFSNLVGLDGDAFCWASWDAYVNDFGLDIDPQTSMQ